jgi:hypothetical protein
MEGVEFANVSEDVLAARGIALDEPRSSPPITEADAAAIASGTAGGQAVLEAHYAHCRVVSKSPPVDQDCWVFSLDPAGLSSMHGGVPADYFLVMVDPVSCEVVLQSYGAAGRGSSRRSRDPRLGPA